MASSTKEYDTAKMNQLLLAAFTPEELRRFCRDRPTFRPVVRRFSPRHSLEDMADELITYCETRLLFDELLAEVKQTNPRQYARFEPNLLITEPKKPPAEIPAPPAPDKASLTSGPVKALAKPRRDEPTAGRGRSEEEEPGMRNGRLGKAANIAQIVGVVVAVLAIGAGLLVPEVRQWVGLEERVTDTPVPSTATPSRPTPTDTPLPPTPTDTPMPPTPTDTPMPPTPALGAIDTWTRPADGALMVYVPAGTFVMGSSDRDPDAFDFERPQNTVYLYAFWIDRTEVTNAQYRRCVEAGACQPPRCWDDSRLNSPDQPVVCVVWDDAQDYAAWVGGRLPTEAEWEKAARGTDGRIYPWGDSPPDCYKTNYSGCAGKPLPVDTHPDGVSPFGVLDMAGNVWEWVADRYDEDYYSRSPATDPQGPDRGDERVLRGGSCINTPRDVRCAVRFRFPPNNWNNVIGFRVVVAPGPSGP